MALRVPLFLVWSMALRDEFAVVVSLVVVVASKKEILAILASVIL